MTTFPRSPKLQKGAIVGIDPFNPLASVIIFQYNPKTMTRSVEAQTTETEGARSEVRRFKGAPTETITINKLDIDATDQLEQGDPTATEMGIYPQLSALEMLLYPKSSTVIANTALLAAGTIELVQPPAPMILFIWGHRRVVPVRIDDFTINEQEYDPRLNPIRAEISSLAMRVLSYNDYSVTHPGYSLFLAHQVIKETMATIGSVNDLSAVGTNVSGLGG